MFYLNRTLSITVANLNSLARKKEKKKKTSRGCPAVLLQQMICCGFSHWCAQTLWTVHQWTARRRSELRAKWIQLKVFDLSVHSTKLPQWFFATSWLTVHCSWAAGCFNVNVSDHHVDFWDLKSYFIIIFYLRVHCVPGCKPFLVLTFSFKNAYGFFLYLIKLFFLCFRTMLLYTVILLYFLLFSFIQNVSLCQVILLLFKRLFEKSTQ